MKPGAKVRLTESYIAELAKEDNTKYCIGTLVGPVLERYVEVRWNNGRSFAYDPKILVELGTSDDTYDWIQRIARIELEKNDQVAKLVKNLSEEELKAIIINVSNYTEETIPEYVCKAVQRWKFELRLRETAKKMEESGSTAWNIYHDCDIKDVPPEPTLLETLIQLNDNYLEPEPYVHQEETAEELFEKVATACIERAKNGCQILRFHWDHVYTTDRKEWERQHQVCLEVVEMLEKEGLNASCNSKFKEPEYDDWYREWVQFDSHHYIEVSWFK